MKKVLYLFAALVLSMTSCSSNDSNRVNPETLILPKTVKYTYLTTGIGYVSQFNYDKNKIVNIVDNDGETIKYIYTGEFITKKEAYNDDVLSSTTVYTYTNGKLTCAVSVETGDEYKYKIAYTHNLNGIVSYKNFRINRATGIEEEYGPIGKYTFDDKNLIKDEESYYGIGKVITYEYDTKDNPGKNVLNLNLLLDEDISTNNEIKSTEVIGENTYIYTTTYTYNSNNFPIKAERFRNGKSDEIVEFTY